MELVHCEAEIFTTWTAQRVFWRYCDSVYTICHGRQNVLTRTRKPRHAVRQRWPVLLRKTLRWSFHTTDSRVQPSLRLTQLHETDQYSNMSAQTPALFDAPMLVQNVMANLTHRRFSISFAELNTIFRPLK